MNIVHIYPSVFRIHGATKWLMLFTTELSRKGNNNTIICVNFDIPIPYWFEGEIKTLFKRKPGKNAKKNYAGLKKLINIFLQILSVFLLPVIIQKNTDIIILHSELSLFASILSRIKFRRIRIVYYCYQPPRELYDLTEYSGRTYGIWFRLLTPFFEIYKIIDKILVRKSDYVLVWSDQAREYAKSIYGDVGFDIVPAGVDFSVFCLDKSGRNRMNHLRHELRLEGKRVLGID